jgi:Tfp pilus assembly protein PilF
VIFRKKGQVAKVRGTAARALEAATAAQRYDYIGAAWANQAWAAWREGDVAQARAYGETALEWWGKHPVTYMFQWMARWPLIGVALSEEDLGGAVEHGRVVLDSSQMRLPDALASPLERALQAWDGGDPDTARTHLQQALGPAREMGYL